jgi:putative addiction module component (TIGR02574 family)
MSRSYEEIRDEAMQLSDDERADLAEELYSSTLSDEERALEDEWDRRAEELISGKVKGIPAEESIARARAALNDARRRSSHG